MEHNFDKDVIKGLKYLTKNHFYFNSGEGVFTAHIPLDITPVESKLVRQFILGMNAESINKRVFKIHIESLTPQEFFERKFYSLILKVDYSADKISQPTFL